MVSHTAVLVGAGQRGRHVYGSWAKGHPDRLRFVAVAEPDPTRRERFADLHDIPSHLRFAGWEELIAAGRLADACIVATPDRLHHAPAMAFMELGYHTLLEKPMAATLAETMALVDRATGPGPTLHVAHVLRYTPFFRALHDIVGSGRLGDVVTVEHRENVVAWHMAHAFVRGNWARTSDATPMIVQKCCHDFDILAWNLSQPVWRLSSTGSLFEFHPERAPQGAMERCTDGCPVVDCPYDARRIYLDPEWTGWPVHVVTDDFSEDGRLSALDSGPYGVCAFRAGSDVVDHQVVLMELEGGASVSLHVHGHSHEESRTMRYDGTRATVRGVFGRKHEITITDHATGHTEIVPIEQASGGHGGGDEGILESLLRSVETGEPGPTGAAASLESHLLAFLAEESRLSGEWINVADRRLQRPAGQV